MYSQTDCGRQTDSPKATGMIGQSFPMSSTSRGSTSERGAAGLKTAGYAPCPEAAYQSLTPKSGDLPLRAGRSPFFLCLNQGERRKTSRSESVSVRRALACAKQIPEKITGCKFHVSGLRPDPTLGIDERPTLTIRNQLPGSFSFEAGPIFPVIQPHIH